MTDHIVRVWKNHETSKDLRTEMKHTTLIDCDMRVSDFIGSVAIGALPNQSLSHNTQKRDYQQLLWRNEKALPIFIIEKVSDNLYRAHSSVNSYKVIIIAQ